LGLAQTEKKAFADVADTMEPLLEFTAFGQVTDTVTFRH